MTTGVLLAIETSQRVGSVAVRAADGAMDHEALRATSRHEDDLMPAIDRLCQRIGVQPRDITAVGVSIGPGGFTGLRIAVSTTKMFAESLGAVVVGVPSALVAAEPIDQHDPILVCLASKRDATWVTRLEREQQRWRIVNEPGLATAEAIDLTDIRCALADEFLPESIRKHIEVAGCAIEAPLFDARACLAVATRMLAAGRTTDSLSLTPIYDRPPEAVRLWEKGERKASRDQRNKGSNGREDRIA